jgi:hypothetical protein
MESPGLVLALSTQTTDQLVVAVGLVLVLAVAVLVVWAYRTNSISARRRGKAHRRPWTVIRGGNRTPPVLKARRKKGRPRRSGPPGQKRDKSAPH